MMDNSIVGIRLRLLLLLNIVRFVHHCVLLLLLLHLIWNRLLRVMRVMGMIWVVMVVVKLLTTTIGGVAAGVAARGVLFARGVGIIVHYYLLTRIGSVVLQGCVSSRA